MSEDGTEEEYYTTSAEEQEENPAIEKCWPGAPRNCQYAQILTVQQDVNGAREA